MLIYNSFWFLVQVACGGTIFVFVWMYYAIKFFESLDGEDIKRYEFGTIKAPDDVQILKKPSIKVLTFHLDIMLFWELTWAGFWFNSYTMLRSSNWTISRTSQPYDTRRHRSSSRESSNRTGKMVSDDVQATQTSSPQHASIHNGQSRGSLSNCMPGFWKDYGRCYIGRDFGHGGEAQMDNSARREGSTAVKETDEPPHDV